MAGKNKTRLVGWHPADPAAVDWLNTEIERRGGGRGVQSAILDEALAGYRERPMAAWITCPACPQSFQIPAAGNMPDALNVIEAHAAAYPGHLKARDG